MMENSDPPIHQHDGSSPTSQRKSAKKGCTKVCWLWTIVILIASALALTLSLVLTRNGGNGPKESSIDDSSIMSGDEYYEYLYQTIGQVSNFWVDPSGPQAAAAEWLAYEDNFRPQYIPVLVQRYVLAVLYFSTGGADLWRGDWLIKDASECSFDGVHCNQDGIVQELHLTQRALSGPLPPEIGLLGGLTVLDLHSNRLKGSIPEELFLLTNLIELNLSVNQLTQRIPEGLARLTNLGLLSLSENLLTGPVPVFPTSIEFMLLDNNRLSGNFEDIVRAGSNLTALELANNNLEGSFPTEIGHMTKLFSLQLYNNDFISGSLPSEIGRLPLRVLLLADLDLNGDIPVELFDSTDLRVLVLSQTSLGGTLATQIGQLRNLRHFGMGYTKLNGPIPSEIGLLSRLVSLQLFYTDISGPIPSELGNCRNLKEIYFQGTKLTGLMPQEMCELPASTFDFEADCNVGGPVQCDCCTICH